MVDQAALGHNDAAEIRRRAEQRVAETLREQELPSLAELPDVLRELRVRQVELELHNEVLQKQVARNEVVEQALRASERHFRQVTESLPQLVWTCQPDGRCDYLSPQWVAYTGIPEAPQLGFEWLEQIHPADRDRLIAAWQQSCGQGSDFIIEFRIRRHDGVYRWFRTLAVPLHDECGNILRWFGTNTDVHDLREATNALKASAEKFHGAFANAAIGFAMTTLDGRFVDANPAYCAVTGYTVDELSELRFWQLFHADDYAENMSQLDKMLTGEISDFVIENRYRRKDGQIVWVRKSISLVRNRQGMPQWFIALVEDITERKRAEEELRENEQRLRWALHGANGGVWDWDLLTGQAWWSPEMYAMWGVTPGTPMQLDNSLNLLHEQDRERIRTAVETSIAQHADYRAEYRIRHATLGIRWMASHGRPVYDASGHPSRLLGITLDITNRRRAEEALLATRKDLDRAQAVSHCGSWRLNIQRNELLWSDESWRIFGIARDTPLTFETFLEAVHPDDRDFVRARWQAALAGEPYDIEHRIVVGNEIKWVREKAELEYDQDGTLLGGFGTTQDITAKKQNEQALSAAKVAAEEANAAKSQFLANISHELRTPMNAILGMVDVALANTSEAIVVDCLQTARESAGLLLKLLSDLLDSAKIESGKLELETAPFSLRRMLDLIARILSTRASEKGLDFRCRVPENAPDAVVGDRTRLEQVLLNLAGNAIKFTDQGRVEILVEADVVADQAHLQFAVRDTGIGISAEEQNRLFQPFTQADASMTRRFGGTGLGLSICRSLLHLMGGQLWVTSELKQGSTFSFSLSLPLAKELPANCEASLTVLPAASISLRILLAEDNPANQKLATYLLQNRGHVVEIAPDGRQAVHLAVQNRYDVILMDVQMPNLNGWEAAVAIRASEGPNALTPIIALTAHVMHGYRQQCLEAGMNAFLPKPIDAQEMIGLVENLARAPSPSPTPIPTASPPLSSPPSHDDSLFDPDEALKRCFGAPEMLRSMIQYYFQEVDSLFPRMHSALQRHDLSEVSNLIHRLKGTIMHLGAERAMQSVTRAEKFCRTGGNSAGQVEQAVQTLFRNCAELRDVLAQFQQTP